MAYNVKLANHTLEWMRRVSAKLDTVVLDIGDFKLRQSSVEDHLSGLIVSMAGLTHRIDRIEGRWIALSGGSTCGAPIDAR